MGSKTEYEYRYSFRVDNEMIHRFRDWYVAVCRMKFVFEVRTSFVLVPTSTTTPEVIDSERYDVGAPENPCRNDLGPRIGRRLRDYWMPKDEIRGFTKKALAFAAAAQITAGDDDPDAMVPVAVDLEVCTVQREGESVESARGRAMTTEFLYPIHLCPVNEAARPKARRSIDMYGAFGMYETYRSCLMYFLREKMRTIRVKEVEVGLDLMEECCICYREPAVGVRLSVLECGHCFHNSCIVRWLEDHGTCPMCRRLIHNMSSIVDENEYENGDGDGDGDEVEDGEDWNEGEDWDEDGDGDGDEDGDEAEAEAEAEAEEDSNTEIFPV